MSAKAASNKAQSKPLLKELKKHLKAAILPGDTPLDAPALDDIAAFLLEAAQKRSPSRSALKIESDTGEKRRLRIAIINDDMPFLVDSIAATITAQGLSIDQLIHPVVAVDRDKSGKLEGFAKKSDKHSCESLIYIETPRIDARQRRDLIAELRHLTVNRQGRSDGPLWRVLQCDGRAE